MAYVPNATIRDWMTAAIEGGSSYWMNDPNDCRKVKVFRDPELNVTCITCEVNPDGKGWKEHIITPITIRKALKQFSTTQMHTKWTNKMLNDPDMDFDDEDADCALQIAIFNDIVYG